MLALILAQATSSAVGEYSQIIFFVGIAVVFYFFMIRPQQKKQKDQKKFLEEIKKGDSVVTIGGMHGKVHSLDDATITLDVDKGTKLTFERSSISLDASKTK
jgi:preprotein translocase subunit YajC